MALENWQTIKALFQSAQELEHAKRSEFLTANCSGPTIREEVQRLLHDQQQGADFLSTPAVDSFVRGTFV